MFAIKSFFVYCSEGIASHSYGKRDLASGKPLSLSLSHTDHQVTRFLLSCIHVNLNMKTHTQLIC